MGSPRLQAEPTVSVSTCCPAGRHCEPLSNRGLPATVLPRTLSSSSGSPSPTSTGWSCATLWKLLFLLHKSKAERESWPCQRPLWAPTSHLHPSWLRKPSQIWHSLRVSGRCCGAPPPGHPTAPCTRRSPAPGAGQKHAMQSKTSRWQNEKHFLHEESGFLCAVFSFSNSGSQSRYFQ